MASMFSFSEMNMAVAVIISRFSPWAVLIKATAQGSQCDTRCDWSIGAYLLEGAWLSSITVRGAEIKGIFNVLTFTERTTTGSAYRFSFGEGETTC
jgi:hypothetical protein